MSREQAAAELRARISANDPALLDVIDGLKEVFGARLKHVRLSDGYEAGDARFNEHGIQIKPYDPPKVSSKGSVKGWLREQEEAHLAAHAGPQQAGASALGRTTRGRRG